MLSLGKRLDELMKSVSVYQIGSACGLLIGAAYLIIIGLYIPIGAPPLNAELLLPYLAKNSPTWSWIIGLSVFTDFLFLPFAASLYFVLKGVNRYITCLAVALIVLFIVLDLAVTWTNYVGLMALGNRYVSALTETQKVSIVTAAEPFSAILHSKLLFVCNSLTLAAGIFLTGILMLNGSFDKAGAYLGIAAGFTGVAAVVGSLFNDALGGAIILASCLTAVWVFVVGYRLWRGAATPVCHE